MTIMNAWVTPTKAIVASDTALVLSSGEGGWAECSKVIAFPHLNAVMVMRGWHLRGHHLRNQLENYGLRSFDEMLRAFPDALSEAENKCLDSPAYSEGANDYHLIAVGWSDDCSRMLGRSIYGSNGAFEAEFFEQICTPWDDKTMDAIPPKESFLNEIAIAQVAHIRESYPAPSGGKLTVAQLTKDGMTISNRDIFPPNATEALSFLKAA